jgi:hypothetical protein
MGDFDTGKGETPLTNSPTPIEGINKFIYNEDRKYPSSPTSDVRSRAKSPVLSGPRDTRSERIGKPGSSEKRT